MVGSIVLTLTFAALAYSTAAAPVHHNERSSGHSEKGEISFYYDYHTHYMAGRTELDCYIMLLSPDQRTSVHTNVGLNILELTMIQMITGNEGLLAGHDLLGRTKDILHFCHGRQMFDLGITPSTSIPTTIPTVTVT